MSQYSETIGSFIRTSNYPLEANYYFESESDLLTFYREPINRATLHRGLLKVVGDQDLYWVAELDGQLYFKKLLSISTLEDLKDAEENINEIKNLLESFDIEDIIQRIDAVADENTERAKKIVGTTEDDIIGYLDTLPYNSITSLSGAIENLIEDLKTKATIESLQKLQDFVEFIKRSHEHDIHNLQTELDQTQVGIGLSGDGGYNSDKETVYLKEATSVMNALKILDSKIKEALDMSMKLLDSSFYDPSTEDLVLIFKTANGVEEVRIPAGDLIEEWVVENPENSAVTLTRTRNIEGKDTLSADVKISSKEKNSLQKESDGLYVKQYETNLDYVDGSLEYSVNGEVIKTIPLVDKLLVTPILSVNWEIYNQDGTIPSEIDSTSSSSALTLERGYKVNSTFKFKWNHDNSKKDPQSTNGVCGTILPSSGVFSSETYIQDIVSNNTYTQSISAPKIGFMVSGTSVIAASGNDTTSARVSITFQDRVYYGNTLSLVPFNIKDLSNSRLQLTKATTISGITTDENSYFTYSYPKSFGILSRITQNGASPVIEDFNLTESTVTNTAGLDIVYYVYTSKNKGAFTNVELKFE